MLEVFLNVERAQNPHFGNHVVSGCYYWDVLIYFKCESFNQNYFLFTISFMRIIELFCH